MKTLTLLPHTRSGSGPRLSEQDFVNKYEVCGLAVGESAWIAKMGGSAIERPWQVLRAKDGVQGHWTGDYASAQDALASLQKECET